MEFSFFSFVMTITFLSIFVIMISFLRKKNKFILSFGIFPIVLVAILTIIRIVFNFEFNYSIIIKSEVIFTAIVDVLRMPVVKEITFSVVLVAIWAVGVILISIKYIKNYIKLKNDFKNMSKYIEKNDSELVKELKLELNIKNNIEVYRSSHINIPIVVGLYNYNIILPNKNIKTADLNNILLHELNHIKGRDNIKKMFIVFLKILFWWNPFIYKFDRDIDHILEIQCDLRTTKNMNKESRRSYLESILNTIKNNNEKPILKLDRENILESSALYECNDENIKQRFVLVLKYFEEKRTSKVKQAILYTLIIGIFLSSYIFTFKTYYYPKEEGIFQLENDPVDEEDLRNYKSDKSFIFKIDRYRLINGS